MSGPTFIKAFDRHHRSITYTRTATSIHFLTVVAKNFTFTIKTYTHFADIMSRPTIYSTHHVYISLRHPVCDFPPRNSASSRTIAVVQRQVIFSLYIFLWCQ